MNAINLRSYFFVIFSSKIFNKINERKFFCKKDIKFKKLFFFVLRSFPVKVSIKSMKESFFFFVCYKIKTCSSIKSHTHTIRVLKHVSIRIAYEN